MQDIFLKSFCFYSEIMFYKNVNNKKYKLEKKSFSNTFYSIGSYRIFIKKNLIPTKQILL